MHRVYLLIRQRALQLSLQGVHKWNLGEISVLSTTMDHYLTTTSGVLLFIKLMDKYDGAAWLIIICPRPRRIENARGRACPLVVFHYARLDSG